MDHKITTSFLLSAYANGYFPMAESRNAEALHWYSPEKRGILPLDTFHVPKSLQKFMLRCGYEVRFDTAFEAVIRACADTVSATRKDTWINAEIIALYCELAATGYAHSVECWHENRLVGGLYGIAMGKAFFGESMFSIEKNASKFALVHLVERLRARDFMLLDTQYVNDHLLQFGVREIGKTAYLELLAEALKTVPPS